MAPTTHSPTCIHTCSYEKWCIFLFTCIYTHEHMHTQGTLDNSCLPRMPFLPLQRTTMWSVKLRSTITIKSNGATEIFSYFYDFYQVVSSSHNINNISWAQLVKPPPVIFEDETETMGLVVNNCYDMVLTGHKILKQWIKKWVPSKTPGSEEQWKKILKIIQPPHTWFHFSWRESVKVFPERWTDNESKTTVTFSVNHVILTPRPRFTKLIILLKYIVATQPALKMIYYKWIRIKW